MKKRINYLLIGIIFLFSRAPTAARSIDDIDSHGIYVAADKGYVKVESYPHYDRFVDFKLLNKIPFANRKTDSLKLIIYEKNFDERSIILELRPLDIVVNIQKLKFHVKPLKRADMYELSVDLPIKNGAMLHVYSAFFDNMGAIMLGDTQEELVKYFGQKQLQRPSIVIQYLEDALVAFPDNSKLKELAVYWQKAAKTEKDQKAYTYVDEKWQQYQRAEKLQLKKRYLDALIVEINGYLNEHPEGYKAEEARKRKAIAEEKLKEYEKLL